ncbi:MAG: caspase family protein [Tychonema bourrellyi B0820]|uniref:Peptidase C14 n=1 Tax=Tychonema bourrellyi FEM_GT703 TaxID=2040638 RepID=A0A2G4EWY5_9CYAN|nr:caspase family protein [Tychonema bourrellyi]MDQ2099033.1 caspase family protein [Tychonema bourrellyi B0820]PHX54062.1 peptidase C14 [Tychonema bourrellyi FEM_GT703]
MGLKRRNFLQQAGWVLAALGISEAGWERLGDRYLQALAQPTARKLALLVGVDQYPGSALHGCVTDVELQRELLVYRFGFQSSDILTLTDSQATRENIETAFVTHLTQQAKPGDAVVFHFSGCGSRLSLGESLTVMPNSLVPVDDRVPTLGNRVVNDILEETLLLLMRSLPTSSSIAILDTSYNYPGFEGAGNFRIRSRPRPIVASPSIGELDLLDRLKLSSNQIYTPTTILTAAAPAQFAAEVQWNGFTAGLFTYALTQTLWWTTPASSLQVSFSRAAGQVEQITGRAQQPQILNDDLQAPSGMFSTSILNLSADGAVSVVEDGGKTVQLWLAGLPPEVLECCGGSVFSSVSSEGGRLLLLRRTGLTAKAQVLIPGQLTAGDLVREEIRVLPRNMGLTVALNSDLERIERVDATSAFAILAQVSAVGGDQRADYRFGRVPERTSSQAAAGYEAGLYRGRYGLFSLGETLIPHSEGDGGEAVKLAVQRLTPQLQTLLAMKLLRLTANEGSSRLKVRAMLATLAPQAQTVAQRSPVRGTGDDRVSSRYGESEKSGSLGILSVKAGSLIQYRLYNDGDLPVYFMVFRSDSSGLLLVLNSDGETSVPRPMQTIAPGANLSLSQARAIGPEASRAIVLAETLIIFSESPFDRTLAALQGGMQQVRDALPIRVLLNPLNVARAVLEDLHAASMTGVKKVGISTDDLALDVSVWATLSFVYRVVY